MPLPGKMFSWTLLIIFFIFDNVLSYYAVTRFGGREANLAIAWLVEKYPLLYFLCIPAQIIIINFIVKGLKKLALRLFKNKVNGDIAERIILSGLAIYWLIGNSSMNLAFLIGHRQPIRNWLILSAVGIFSAVTYSLINLKKLSRN